MLKQQKAEIDNVKKIKQDLKSHMKTYKDEQDKKRAEMQRAIARQKDLIKEKEKRIEEKNQELAELQESNKMELDRLNQ